MSQRSSHKDETLPARTPRPSLIRRIFRKSRERKSFNFAPVFLPVHSHFSSPRSLSLSLSSFASISSLPPPNLHISGAFFFSRACSLIASLPFLLLLLSFFLPSSSRRGELSLSFSYPIASRINTLAAYGHRSASTTGTSSSGSSRKCDCCSISCVLIALAALNDVITE